MSPTVFRTGEHRLDFLFREELRMHVHVHHATGEAKVRVEPRVEVARNHGLSRPRLGAVPRLTEEHWVEIREAWAAHVGR